MGFCGEDNIGVGRSRSASAESRYTNTRKEVAFLAAAYYDCAQFVFNSGFRDIQVVNNQFGNMLNTYVQAGRIKRESFNKFMSLSVGIDITAYNKESYVNKVEQAFLALDIQADKFKGGNIRKQFKTFLKSLGLNIGTKKEDIIYMQFLYDIAAATDNQGVKEIADKQKVELGLRSIDFKGPQIRISDGDGCGHGTIYGNALEHYNKL